MAAAAADTTHVVIVVSAYSGEHVATLSVPAETTIRQVKHSLVEAAQGSSVFCQRLILESTGKPVEDEATLTSLLTGGELAGPLRLILVKLSYVDADEGDEAAERLLDAVQDGRSDEVEELLRLPTWPDNVDEKGQTALYRASCRGHAEAARLLCEARAELEKAVVSGATALSAAAKAGHQDVVRWLCAARADVDKATPFCATPLYMASKGGFPEVVRLLCEARADVDKAMPGEAAALHAAAQGGHQEVARRLCEAGARVNKAMFDGTTPLYIASLVGRAEMARLLCQARADITVKLDTTGMTALEAAAQNGHHEVVQLLAEASGQPVPTAMSQATSGCRTAKRAPSAVTQPPRPCLQRLAMASQRLCAIAQQGSSRSRDPGRSTKAPRPRDNGPAQAG